MYYDGKRVDLGINLYIDKNLGNGFYTALYYRHGTFNTKGNILTLDQVSFPIVNKENAPKDLFSRTAIDENLKKIFLHVILSRLKNKKNSPMFY